ncbi:hypothetical protein STEG23_026625 [Scotinomys teguina]
MQPVLHRVSAVLRQYCVILCCTVLCRAVPPPYCTVHSVVGCTVLSVLYCVSSCQSPGCTVPVLRCAVSGHQYCTACAVLLVLCQYSQYCVSRAVLCPCAARTCVTAYCTAACVVCAVLYCAAAVLASVLHHTVSQLTVLFALYCTVPCCATGALIARQYCMYCTVSDCAVHTVCVAVSVSLYCASRISQSVSAVTVRTCQYLSVCVLCHSRVLCQLCAVSVSVSQSYCAVLHCTALQLRQYCAVTYALCCTGVVLYCAAVPYCTRLCCKAVHCVLCCAVLYCAVYSTEGRNQNTILHDRGETGMEGLNKEWGEKGTVTLWEAPVAPCSGVKVLCSDIPENRTALQHRNGLLVCRL